MRSSKGKRCDGGFLLVTPVSAQRGVLTRKNNSVLLDLGPFLLPFRFSCVLSYAVLGKSAHLCVYVSFQ